MLMRAGTEWMIPPAQMMYVGDMASDEEAVRNAGVSFVHASAIATLVA
jgi:phosphoglycolate phosphatase-like HAD superfamily hydrolase